MTRYSYSRVSTKSQSTDNQVQLIEDSNYKTDVWITEQGVSGTIECLDRPAFKAMMEILEEGDEVCVSALDRLGRNAADILKTVEAFVALKVKLRILAFDNVDVTTAYGKMFVSMLAVFAELDRNQIVDRVKSGIARVQSEGMILGKALTITPHTMEAMCLDKDRGCTLAEISAKHRIAISTAGRNINQWANKLAEYHDAYYARVDQDARHKAAKIAALDKPTRA